MTYGLEGRCSIQLSYWRRTSRPGAAREPISRGDRIRTCDPLVPNQVRYRAAPLPEARRSRRGQAIMVYTIP